MLGFNTKNTRMMPDVVVMPFFQGFNCRLWTGKCMNSAEKKKTTKN